EDFVEVYEVDVFVGRRRRGGGGGDGRRGLVAIGGDVVAIGGCFVAAELQEYRLAQTVVAGPLLVRDPEHQTGIAPGVGVGEWANRLSCRRFPPSRAWSLRGASRRRAPVGGRHSGAGRRAAIVASIRLCR